MATDGLPMIPLKFFGGAMGDLPSPEEAALRTLIAAKDSPYSASFYPSPLRSGFYPEFGISFNAIR